MVVVVAVVVGQSVVLAARVCVVGVGGASGGGDAGTAHLRLRRGATGPCRPAASQPRSDPAALCRKRCQALRQPPRGGARDLPWWAPQPPPALSPPPACLSREAERPHARTPAAPCPAVSPAPPGPGLRQRGRGGHAPRHKLSKPPRPKPRMLSAGRIAVGGAVAASATWLDRCGQPASGDTRPARLEQLPEDTHATIRCAAATACWPAGQGGGARGRMPCNGMVGPRWRAAPGDTPYRHTAAVASRKPRKYRMFASPTQALIQLRRAGVLGIHCVQLRTARGAAVRRHKCRRKEEQSALCGPGRSHAQRRVEGQAAGVGEGHGPVCMAPSARLHPSVILGAGPAARPLAAAQRVRLWGCTSRCRAPMQLPAVPCATLLPPPPPNVRNPLAAHMQ